jgi:hypothetical protein
LLAPHQPGWATEHRQIDQFDLPHTVTMRDDPAQLGGVSTVIITIRNQLGQSPTPNTATSGNPTRSGSCQAF